MINGLYVARALHFALGGRQQPIDGGLHETCTTVMPGYKFRLGESYLRKLALECERYPDVQGSRRERSRLATATSWSKACLNV